jgi:amidase
VLNRNPLSRNKGNPRTPPIVFLYELKRDLNLYLRDWAVGTDDQDDGRHHRLQPGQRRQGAALRPGPVPRRRGDTRRPRELEYKSARAMDLLAAKERGIDAYMSQHKLDAIVFPANTGASIAAKPGYPSVLVPAGFTSGFDGKDTPDYPLGLTFTGRAWSEHKLLKLAYAFEQAANARKPPTF